MAENNFKCTGNCLQCSPAQRGYCACQHAYSNMQVLDKMMNEVLYLKETVGVLEGKIEALQKDNDAVVFDPKGEKSEIPNLPIAQEGVGAVEVEAPK